MASRTMRKKNAQKRREKEKQDYKIPKMVLEWENFLWISWNFRKSSRFDETLLLTLPEPSKIRRIFEETKYPNVPITFSDRSDPFSFSTKSVFNSPPGPVLLFICNGNNRPRRYIRTRRIANSWSGAISTSYCERSHCSTHSLDVVRRYLFFPTLGNFLSSLPRNPRFFFLRRLFANANPTGRLCLLSFVVPPPPHRRELCLIAGRA